MNSIVLCLLLPAFFVPLSPQDTKLEEAFIAHDSLDYDGYRIERTFKKWRDDRMGDSRIVVMRGKKRLAMMNGCCFKDSVRYALVSLLGNGSKQLLIETYSGGGHCCTSYYIYGLNRHFHMLFDGGAYTADDVGYSMRLLDIDKDGKKEFVQSVMNFDYFWSPHARSVFPEVVFAYDARARKYLPANRKFTSYLLRDIDEKKRLVDELNADTKSVARIIGGRGSEKTSEDSQLRIEYFHAVVDVTLTYIFAGQRAEGWRYFDQNYRLRDKQQLKAAVLDTLRSSQIYNLTYRTKRRSR